MNVKWLLAPHENVLKEIQYFLKFHFILVILIIMFENIETQNILKTVFNRAEMAPTAFNNVFIYLD